MLRRHLSIYDPTRTKGETRLALVLDGDGNPEYLHADDSESAGRFARVIRGYLGYGRVRERVAVKIERHELPPSVGEAKFLSEYQAQCAVHNDLGDDQRTRVVQMRDPWGAAGQECDTLPPTLICRRSRHLIAPQCPCGRELPDDGYCAGRCELPAVAQDRHDAVRAATRCAACRASGAACHPYWLVTRTCRMIVLELLDVDLGEYVRWRWCRRTPAPRPGWAKYTATHRPALPEYHPDGAANPQPLAELDFLLGLFQDALGGVREMHGKRIPHLDLKPANLCLTLDGGAAHVKVIDLGQADAPSVRWAVRQRSINDDTARHLRDLVYSAPEQLDRFAAPECEWRPAPNGCELRVAATVDVLPGDWCYVTLPGADVAFHRVVAVRTARHGRIVTAWAVRPEEPLPEPSSVDANVTADWLPGAEVGFVRDAGGSADVFSLGMVLLFLLTRERIDLGVLRRNLPALATAVEKLAADTPQLQTRPARFLADELLRSVPVLATLNAHVRAVPGPLQSVYLELVGVAVRALVRGVPRVSYCAHRNDYSIATLDRFAADVVAVRSRLQVLIRDDDLNTGRVAARRRAGLVRLRAWLKVQPQAAARGAAPPYGRERLCEAFDFLEQDPTPDRELAEFEALFDHYRRNALALEKDLDLFAKELVAKQLSVDRIHPVVEKVFRFFNREVEPNSDQRPLVEACKHLLALRKSLLAHLGKVTALLDTIDPARGVIWFTDAAARGAGETRDKLLALNDGIRTGAAEVMACLERWLDFQRQPFEEWKRLLEAASWQTFADGPLHQLRSRLASARQWHAHVARLHADVPRLTDAWDRAFLAPWPAARRKYRWSPRGAWRRFVAWATRKPFETPLRVAPGTAEEIRRGAEQLGGTLKELKRQLPSVGLVGAPPADA